MDDPVVLQSVADTHERPFIVIDRDFRVVTVNRAFEKAYHTSREHVIGQACYQVSHHNDRPCYELGEECPHRHIFEGGEACSCLHSHYDAQNRVHRLRIRGYPVYTDADTVYLGESLQALALPLETAQHAYSMAGQSPLFLQRLEQLRLSAMSDAPVLLEGESGTGKELAARFIHQHSRRHDKQFLVMDCTTLTESLFEAEVFGYERGAFTGSVGDKKGLFETVDGGTLFLDEIGELPFALQAKLLRVLESGEFRRVGGHRTLRTNARIICATNRDLILAVQNKTFREDLFYRIACFHIMLPALRERISDIPLLAQSLIKKINDGADRQYTLDKDAFALLQSHDYPGNIRELRNILSKAMAYSPDGRIDAGCITSVLQQHNRYRASSPAETEPVKSEDTVPTGTNLHELESRHIAWLLKQHNGNRRKVAASLGISERTMYRKLKRHDLT